MSLCRAGTLRPLKSSSWSSLLSPLAACVLRSVCDLILRTWCKWGPAVFVCAWLVSFCVVSSGFTVLCHTFSFLFLARERCVRGGRLPYPCARQRTRGLACAWLPWMAPRGHSAHGVHVSLGSWGLVPSRELLPHLLVRCLVLGPAAILCPTGRLLPSFLFQPLCGSGAEGSPPPQSPRGDGALSLILPASLWGSDDEDGVLSLCTWFPLRLRALSGPHFLYCYFLFGLIFCSEMFKSLSHCILCPSWSCFCCGHRGSGIQHPDVTGSSLQFVPSWGR